MDIPWSRWACRLLGCWKDWSHRLVTSSLEVKENFQFTRDAPKREDGLSKCPPHVWRVSRRLKRNSFRSYKLLTVSQVSSNFSLWCFYPSQQLISFNLILPWTKKPNGRHLETPGNSGNLQQLSNGPDTQRRCRDDGTFNVIGVMKQFIPSTCLQWCWLVFGICLIYCLICQVLKQVVL